VKENGGWRAGGGGIKGVRRLVDIKRGPVGPGGERDMQVNEIMIRGSVAVGCRATAAETWRLLHALGIRQVPVVDERQRLVGLVSDHDLAPPPWTATDPERDGAPAAPRPDAPVAELMAGRAHLFVDEDDDLDAVVDLMVENNTSVVPVVDGNVKVVGIVSYLDVLRVVLARRLRHDTAVAPRSAPDRADPAADAV
jgi:CBS domain-containing protein